MIAAIVDGGNMPGLMRYLVGPGRANEHVDQHLVAGSPAVMRRWGDWPQLTTAQATEIGRHLDQYMAETGTYPTGELRQYNSSREEIETHKGKPNHVWHCSLSLHPDEPALSDQQWAEIATMFMDEMGFTGSDGKAPCRWVAVHHGTSKSGGDHIHIAANIVREDGTKWSRWGDQRRAMKVCTRIEQQFGLMVIESRLVGRGARTDTNEAQREAVRLGLPKTDRQELEDRLRTAVAAAADEVEFIERARELGVRVRPRFAPGSADEVTGYSAALHTAGGERTNWWGAGRIARDLALPVLRRRWPTTARAKVEAAAAWRSAWAGMPISRPKRIHASEAWAGAADAVERALARMGTLDVTRPISLADAAADASGLLSAAATMYQDSNPQVARALWRAGRGLGRCAQLHEHAPRTEPRVELIGTARLLMTAATIDQGAHGARLLADLMRLAAAVIAAHQAAEQANTARAMLRETQEAWRLMRAPTPLADYVAGVASFQNFQRTRPDAPTQATRLPAKKKEREVPELTVEQFNRTRSILAAAGADRPFRPTTSGQEEQGMSPPTVPLPVRRHGPRI